MFYKMICFFRGHSPVRDLDILGRTVGFYCDRCHQELE